jgi:hypothetical protein
MLYYGVTDVSYLKDYQILVSFADQTQKIVDLSDHVQDGEIFAPLRQVDYFKTVFVNPDIATITWNNGADFAPEFLYRVGVKV